MWRGFWATLIGGGVGGFAGLFPGAYFGWFVAPEGEGLEGLEWVFGFAALGAWVGAVSGAYLALRALKVPERGSRLLWLSILVPVLVGAGTWAAVTMTDADDFGSNFLPYCVFGASVVATAYLSNRFAGGTTS